MARAAVGKMSWEGYALLSARDANPAFIPTFIYGTAWKKDHSADLVHQAISAGFRAVDTAAQPKHYREDLVGDGIRRAIGDGVVRREDLYIQTKFTSVHGQSPDDMPYNPKDSITDQVHASVKSSLYNLRPAAVPESADEAYIDTVVLHSPLPTMAQTLEAWTALETYVPHLIRNLGISNTTLPILRELSSLVKVKPAVVQNRFYGGTQFDVPLRAYCRERQLVYQSFWTLTANPELVQSRPVLSLSREARVSSAVALYGLILGLGRTTILNGTTKKAHMEEDLAALKSLERYSKENPDDWQSYLEDFQRDIGDHVLLQ
ncbi:NADP-dependent oxidoreductase domain-containing protein [Aspergillus pseudodeflectus]|uniref:NADP-dependent oxidoreductase domain-containing protein n=1 Tax=Aspergillus pseudodeflectus TaxID=176178 RepID=A0ABR4KBW3_9EURO